MIRLNQVSKSYFDGNTQSTIWALKDISFKIGQGESVGLIGPNGSGKSTLLKILSRITTPSSGKAEVLGRVMALLELGTGFHPELTGRENIFLNGAMLGISRREVKKRLDAIIDFSGVEAFIDTPVRCYSSGMVVRLGFSVAVHFNPEVLLIDEVFAVGDIDFRGKCVDRIRSITQSGTTVLAAGHDLVSMAYMLPRSIYLSQGTLRADGPSNDVVNLYARVATERVASIEYKANPLQVACVTGIQMRNVDAQGRSQFNFKKKEPITLAVDLQTSVPLTNVQAHVCLAFEDFFRLSDETCQLKQTLEPGGHRLRLAIPGILRMGSYLARVTLESNGQPIEGPYRYSWLSFEVKEDCPRPGISAPIYLSPSMEAVPPGA